MITGKRLAMLAASACLIVASCAQNPSDNGNAKRIQAVTSFSILTDIVEEIAGQYVDVYNLVPIGTDPHEYEPKPDDVKKASDADVVIYNGLNLEGGSSGWFAKLMESADQDDEHLLPASSGIEPMMLTDENSGKGKHVNPHAFIDPVAGMAMVRNIRDGLITIDPEHKAEFEKNADVYLSRLKDISNDYTEKINEIPKDQRILITSERAYQYLAHRYGLKEGFIWAIDTEETGTPEQIKKLITMIDDKNVPGLFVESNVDSRPMESVAKETGLKIKGKLYSDEIGTPDSDANTYLSYLQHNIDVIHSVLTP